MKRLLLLLTIIVAAFNSAFIFAANDISYSKRSSELENAPYVPMLQAGKTWTYVMHDESIQRRPVYLQTISLGDTVSINGLTYYPIIIPHTYNDGWTNVYLREDTAERKVWFLAYDNADLYPFFEMYIEDRLLYDFNKREFFDLGWYRTRQGKGENFIFENSGNQYPAFSIDNTDKETIVAQGLGCICVSNDRSTHDLTTFLGSQPRVTGPAHNLPYYLLSVKDGEGNTLYENAEVAACGDALAQGNSQRQWPLNQSELLRRRCHR